MEYTKMEYHGVEVRIKQASNGKTLYIINSPLHGRQRIFTEKHYLYNYIDNTEDVELRCHYMMLD